MADQQFQNLLQVLTADPVIWQYFNPAAWQNHVDSDAERDATAKTPATSAPTEAASQDDRQEHVYLDENSKSEPFELVQRTGGPRLNRAREFAADEPTVARDPRKLENVNWPEIGLNLGDVSREGDMFVPWNFVEHYHEQFVGKRNADRVKPAFDEDALHERRVWDLFYIYKKKQLAKKENPTEQDNPTKKDKPTRKTESILLVPTGQFEHLLDVVNAEYETLLKIPEGRNRDKFTLSFGAGNGPRPRFLGRSDSKAAFEALKAAVPERKPEDDLSNATAEGCAEFDRLMSLTHSRGRRKDGPDRNREKRASNHIAWGRSIKRVQRYLGLRRRVGNGNAPATDVSRDLDFYQPMPYKSDRLPLFVAIDIEAYEFNQNLISEVGIAMLDTARVADVAPGKDGQGWFSRIHARHIRIEENRWAKNNRYVAGCPDKFDFGMSEYIKEKDVASIIAQVINQAAWVDHADGIAKIRPVVLVFHEAPSDIKYLETLGYDIYKARNVIEVVDTRQMHQFVAKRKDAASLASVLDSLDLSYMHLHNAGNDAVYTLRAMIGLAVKRRLQRLEKARKGEGYLKFSKEEMNEGWVSGGEDTDGGWPVKPVRPLAGL